MTPNAQLLLDGNRGIYIPQQFATQSIWPVPDQLHEHFEILKYGPEHPEYWERWDDILLWFKPEMNGKKYKLYHDGDLWLIPEDEAHLMDEYEDVVIEHNRYDWIATYRNDYGGFMANRPFTNKTQFEAEELAEQFFPEGCTNYSIHKRETK